MKIAIVIPTYNENENISTLVKTILSIFPKAFIVVVDDSSPLENKKLHSRLDKYNKSVEILSRYKKGGRGSAVITGFTHALKNKNIEYFFEMDADLAHNPYEIERFLSRKNNADLIIGSRYLSQSKINHWPLRRLVLSKIINVFLKLWLGLDLTDYTNGFRMYNRKAVEFLSKTQMHEKGFIMLSEIAYKLKKAGYKIIEVPISFKDRTYGKSKAGIYEHMSALIGVIRIRFI